MWAGADDGRDGYGRILIPGTRVLTSAHRYVYKTFIGPIPPLAHIDHLCRAWTPPEYKRYIKKCVNPSHLEAVTRQVNHQRWIADDIKWKILDPRDPTIPDEEWAFK